MAKKSTKPKKTILSAANKRSAKTKLRADISTFALTMKGFRDDAFDLITKTLHHAETIADTLHQEIRENSNLLLSQGHELHYRTLTSIADMNQEITQLKTQVKVGLRLPSIIGAASNREGLSDGAKSMCVLRIMAE